MHGSFPLKSIDFTFQEKNIWGFVFGKMLLLLHHTDIWKTGRDNSPSNCRWLLLPAGGEAQRAGWARTLRRLFSTSSDSHNHGAVAEILLASVSLSGKWANHLASDLLPRSVARINELIILEEHFELRMKDTEEQRVWLLCIIKSFNRNVGLSEPPMPQSPESDIA